MTSAQEVPFVEPKDGEVAGSYAPSTEILPYEQFMIDDGIPIYRRKGVQDIRELELGPWERLGAEGAHLPLEGASHTLGLSVLRLLPNSPSAPERHVYEEVFQVFEGHGSTEVWLDSKEAAYVFEWQAGSFFRVPRNAWHRHIPATRDGALMLVANNAPRLINAVDDAGFVFDNPYVFPGNEAWTGETFEARLDFLTSNNGRPMLKTNIIPQLAGMQLAKDGQRAPGQTRMQLDDANSRMFVFTNEYPIGRYSRAHYHPSGAVLVCLRGKGYTYNWPRECGIRPWEEGHGEKVELVEYVEGGLVAAAPGGGDWFHQHFGVGTTPLRLLAISSVSHEELRGQGIPGESTTSLNLPIEEGGSTIPYYDEDPKVRDEFESRLAADGLESEMPDEAYQR